MTSSHPPFAWLRGVVRWWGGTVVSVCGRWTGHLRWLARLYGRYRFCLPWFYTSYAVCQLCTCVRRLIVVESGTSAMTVRCYSWCGSGRGIELEDYACEGSKAQASVQKEHALRVSWLQFQRCKFKRHTQNVHTGKPIHVTSVAVALNQLRRTSIGLLHLHLFTLKLIQRKFKLKQQNFRLKQKDIKIKQRELKSKRWDFK